MGEYSPTVQAILYVGPAGIIGTRLVQARINRLLLKNRKSSVVLKISSTWLYVNELPFILRVIPMTFPHKTFYLKVISCLLSSDIYSTFSFPLFYCFLFLNSMYIHELCIMHMYIHWRSSAYVVSQAHLCLVLAS